MDAPLLLVNIFSQLPSNWGLAAALGVACLLLLRGNWRKQRQSQSSTPDPKEIQQSFAAKTRELSAHHAPEDLLRWQVEMHELARDVKAEIDTKILALQSLMTIANEHSQRLETLLAEAERTGVKQPNAPLSGREILSRIENLSCDLPPLDAKTQGREILNAAQAKLARQLASEAEYTPAQIAQYIGANPVDVEAFLCLQ